MQKVSNSAGSSILVVAGEKSAEEHFLKIFSDWKAVDPTVHFWGVGGDDMAQMGVELHYHLREFSSWGLSEVIGKIPFYIKAMKSLVNEVKRRKVKFALLIDFQTFNLKLAEKLHANGVKVFYYVAPQAWAWKEYRVRRLSRAAEILFAFIPFEKSWFSQRGVKQVIHVAHPLFVKDCHLWPKFQDNKFPGGKNEIQFLLLPGSRNQEVRFLLPLFLATAKKLKEKNFNIRVNIVVSSSVDKEHYLPIEKEQITIYSDRELNQALLKAHFCLAASGTVTLSMALFGVPGLVIYKGSLLEQFVYENIVKYRGPIALANIFLQRKVYPEFLQDRATVHELVYFTEKFLLEKKKWEDQRENLLQSQLLLQGELSDPGSYMAKFVAGNA